MNAFELPQVTGRNPTGVGITKNVIMTQFRIIKTKQKNNTDRNLNTETANNNNLI